MGALGPVTATGIAGLAGLLVLSLYLRRRLTITERAGTALADDAARLQRELTLVRRQMTLLQAEQQFMGHFVREFPLLTGELHAGVSERRIPGVLLGIVLRVLQPRQAVVLVRRKGSASSPERAERLVVAAASPAEGPLQPGFEVTLGQGPVGLVAAGQVAMDRRELDAQRLQAGLEPAGFALPGFDVDLAAPMVIEGKTVGAIAVSGLQRPSAETKDVLRLVAQIGALAVHYVSAYTEVKVTADLDGLTGVYNKRHMTDVLAETVFRSRQQAGRMAVFLFDVDNFKHYNDTNGHTAGDHLLRQLAQLVEENVRKENTFGRFGGEEFLLVLPDTTAEQALIVAEKLRYLIAHHVFPFGEKQPLGCVTVSGGIAAYPAHGLDSAALLQAADGALYEAKHQGRNRVLSGRARHLGYESDAAAEAAGVGGGLSPSWEWSNE